MSDALEDYGKQIRNAVSIINHSASAYLEKCPVVKNTIDYMLRFTDEKLKQTQPEIMVYGIYNAGKSSIINELVGNDVAEVNDIPTTNKVQYYSVNGYRIADTPGVGAPIEHEEVTNAHLRSADVVLFVMSSTGSHDKRQNYERIRDIFNSEKKVIIILNDKNGDLGNVTKGDDGYTGNDRISLIKTKIGENLRNIGLDNSQFNIICVNAKRAKTGRTENKIQLIEKSNITELVQVINQEVKNSRSGRNLRTLAAQLVTESQKVIDGLDTIIESSSSEKHINNFLSVVREQVTCLRSDINSFIERRFSELSVQLPDLLWQNRENSQVSENCLKDNVAVQFRVIKENLVSKLKELDETLRENAEQFNLHHDGGSGNLPVEINAYSPDNFREIISLIDKGINDRSSDQFGSDSGSSHTSSEGPDLAKAVAVTGGSFIALKTALTTFGMANPVLTVVGAVLFGAFSIFSSNDDDDERKARAFRANEMARLAAEKQAQAELRTKCKYLCNDLIDKTKVSVGAIIDEVNKSLVAPYKELAYKVREENGKLVDELESIKSAVDTLNMIKECLKSE